MASEREIFAPLPSLRIRIGRREVAYLSPSTAEIIERRISRIVTLEPPVLIVADAQTPPDKLVAMCDRADIPLFVTDESAGHVIDVVRGYLGQLFAERTTRHGVFALIGSW